MKYISFLTLFLIVFSVGASSQYLETGKLFAPHVYPTIIWNERGNLDTTFGLQGKVTSQIPAASLGSFIQPDGRLVVFGNTASSIVITRFNENGALDSTFGSNGTAILNDTGVGVKSAILLSDGKILLVCGDFFSKTVLIRLNSIGTIDSTFGVNAFLLLVQSNTAPDSAVKQIDGKIVIVATSPSNGKLIRCSSEGVLDSQFGINGIVNLPTNFDQAVKLQDDGKIVVGGSVTNAGTENSALVRVNSDGSFDTTFGLNGLSETNFHKGRDRIFSLGIQPDGKILAGGAVAINSFFSAISAIARFNTDGSLDNSFNSNGMFTGVFEQPNGPVVSIAIQSDGKILAAGNSFRHFGVARLNSNGSLDTKSDLNNPLSYYPQIATIGIASTSSDRLNGVHIQSDGKIIAVGDTTSGQITSFFVSRLNPNPLVHTRGLRGHVVNQKNRGLSRIIIRIQNNNTGDSFTVLSNQFGYFGLSNLPLNHTYSVFTNKKSGFLLPFFNFQLMEDTGDMILQTNF